MSKYEDLSPKRKEGIKASVIKRRKQLKIDLIEYKGGGCSRCGYNKCVAALEFHHLDPKTKKFALTTMNRSWDILTEEADKCVLLCSNCHREIHNGM